MPSAHKATIRKTMGRKSASVKNLRSGSNGLGNFKDTACLYQARLSLVDKGLVYRTRPPEVEKRPSETLDQVSQERLGADEKYAIM